VSHTGESLRESAPVTPIKSGTLPSRLILGANSNNNILEKCGVEKFTSELILVVENKFCRLLRKSYSFALNKDIINLNLIWSLKMECVELKSSPTNSVFFG